MQVGFRKAQASNVNDHQQAASVNGWGFSFGFCGMFRALHELRFDEKAF